MSVLDLFRLDGQVALITGATRGIGLGIAQAFADAGARLVLSSKTPKPEVIAELKQRGAQVDYIQADMLDETAPAKLIADTLKLTGGRLDILVNNAGVAHTRGPATEVSEDAFDRVCAVNVKSIFHFTQAAVPALRRAGGGVIVNIGSTAGIRPRPGLTWYNASKGAVHVATKSLAVELAADKIRVCALAPTIGETALLPTFMGGDTAALREKFAANVPLGRITTPQDVANAALFFASPEAEFLTGVVMEIDGGRSV
jgi:3-oxoacyl-[acyl-carrier protein] reductase